MSSAISRFANRNPLLVGIITWILRFFVGGMFIFSGFTKGIDTWGTIFKFNEYFSVWGYEVWDALNVVGVFILCIIEFLTGFFLVFGCFRKAAPIIAILIMAFMLPLTLWLAVNNPISDCGCFGDAIKLSNWETFYKNVVLTLCLIWLVVFNRRVICLITPYLQWIAAVAAGIYLLAVAWLGYYYQPLIDFRPYKIGTDLVVHDESADSGEDEDDYLRFVYEKDGQKKTFTINDQLPDESDGWTFVERYYETPAEVSDNDLPATPAPIKGEPTKNLRFFTENGREDVTEEVIGNGRQLILMIPKLSDVSAARTWKINSFYDWCEKNDIEMIAAVGGNPMEIEQWKDISQAQYPIYTSDDTSIEEVVRGNPGVVYIEDGIIKWKSSLKAIDIDDFQDPEVSSNPMSFARDNERILYNLTWIFIGITAVLVFLSVSPKIIMSFFRDRKSRLMPVKRMIAEWNNPKSILLTLPGKDTDWNYILEEAQNQYRAIIDSLLEGGEHIILICDGDAPEDIVAKVEASGGLVIKDIPFNDTWTRDYGPITVIKDGKFRELDFGFNGWGLKFASDKDNLVNLQMVEKGYRNRKNYRNNRDYVLEGGSIESDGEGSVLTTSRCLCSPERNGGKSKEEIERILRHRIGARRVMWLDHGFLEGDDTDSHIDTLARIAPNGTIIYVAPPEEKEDIHYHELAEMEKQLKQLHTKEGKKYTLLALPLPDAIYDEDGNRLPATYANYLVTGRNVYVPVYGQPEKDDIACEVITKAFPDHTLHRVDCRTLIKQHGSLHCSTMQLYL